MIHPALMDREFLDDVAAEKEPGSLHLWWLGQSGFLVQWQGRHLLLDPYLSDSLTAKYASTDKPHVRMSERVVDPAALNFIDVVTSSHNHTDHLDAETLLPLLEANPTLQIVAPQANIAFVSERLGVAPARVTGVDAGKSVSAGPFTIHGVPAAHEQVERDKDGCCLCLGYVAQAGPYVLYHSGDTLHYEGMEDWLRRFNVDVALLPVNGRSPERRVAGNLSGVEAADLARAIGAGLVVPCHYDMFEFNTASPDEFAARAVAIGQPYRIVRAGERFSICQPQTSKYP